MQDLTRLFNSAKTTLYFNNFFKTIAYKTAKEVLEELGTPQHDIMTRSQPARGVPAQTMAHDLIALLFVQWLDDARFSRTLLKLLRARQEQHD